MRIPENRCVCAQGSRAWMRIHRREAPATASGSVRELGTRPRPRSKAMATGKAVNTATTTIFEAMVKPIQITMRGAIATRGIVWETTRIGMATWETRGQSDVVKAMMTPTAIPTSMPAIPSMPVAHAAALSDGQLAIAEVTMVVGAGRIRSGRPDQAWRICHAVTTTPREASAQAERTTLSRVRPASELGLLKEIIGHHVCAAQAGECGLPVGVFEEACSLQVVDVTLPTINVAVTDAAS